MQRVVVLVGPTSVGKSNLALRLSKRFDGEIVGADSRQVYRYMDIGTAKPTPEDRRAVSHHLIDIIDPDEHFSLAQYQQLAYEAIADVSGRHKLPLLVGGTGQYIWAVLEGWDVPKVAPEFALRRQLEERAARGEATELYVELQAIDRNAANKIDPRNVRRIIRAIEVSKTTGTPFSELQKRKAPPFRTLIIGLTTERSELYGRTDSRVDRMMKEGLVEEVRRLIEMGYGLNLPSMSGIGYRQIGEHLNGKADLESAVRKIKTETHRFVRHQNNWFRLSDERIRWFDIRDDNVEKKVAAEIMNYISIE